MENRNGEKLATEMKNDGESRNVAETKADDHAKRGVGPLASACRVNKSTWAERELQKNKK